MEVTGLSCAAVASVTLNLFKLFVLSLKAATFSHFNKYLTGFITIGKYLEYKKCEKS